MNDIKEYLQAHFRENSLTVTSVAVQFGISVSYLSRSFKSTYNINLLEYIQRLRVNEAKKLLLTDSVQNVAREVGFRDTQALIRSFKKLEGTYQCKIFVGSFVTEPPTQEPRRIDQGCDASPPAARRAHTYV